MAKDKSSFLLYRDIIHTVRKLPDKDAGELFKHILSYVNDENPTTDNLLVDLAFEPIKQSLKRDLKRYEEIVKKRSEAGRASAELRKQNQQMSTSVESVQQSSTKSTVIDSDSVSDSDIVIDKRNYKNILLSEIIISDFPEIKSEYFESAKAFQLLFKTNLEEAGAQTSQIEKAKGTWIDDIRLIIEKDKYSMNDLRAVYRFLQKDAFWKQNILSTSKLREQMPKLKLKIHNGESRTNSKEGTSWNQLAEIVQSAFAD